MDPKKDKKSGNNEGFNIFNLLVVGLIITIIINMTVASMGSKSLEQIGYNHFILFAENGLIESVEVTEDRYLIQLKDDVEYETIAEILQKEDEKLLEDQEVPEQEAESDGIINPLQDEINRRNEALKEAFEQNKTYYTGIVPHPELTTLLLKNNVNFGHTPAESNIIVDFIISWVLPIALFYFMFTLLTRSMTKRMGGGIMNVGKSNAKLYNLEKQTGITFDDVAGQEEAKESLTEIIDFLHNPEKYAKIGAKQPKGALLVGPPGTGKTLLAKAVAGEANVPFFSLSGSEFIEMYVGVGASRVRDLFKQANQIAPCIIFIDEIDAIGKSRDNQMGSNDEREQTLNQLLAEMDGFDTSKGIMILAATNRPEILDKALLRPGRFDRRIIVEKPDLPGRIAILEVHAKKVKLDSDVNLKQIALATSGAAGADLANMINEAALRAVRFGRDAVKQEDLMEAVEVVIAGKEKKDRVLSDKEKRLVAYHEVGHALAAALQKNAQPVQKITIVPRTMGSLGYVMTMPEDEKYLMTKDELLDEITVKMGGRAAEKVVFDVETTGASNDIEQATKMARSMVSMYGMSEKFGMMGLESIENRYLDGRAVSLCSQDTEAERDKEVKKILDYCYQKSLDLLRDNTEVLHNISAFLIERENITGEEFMEILKTYKTDFVEVKNENMNK